jgi:hypothetical protein
MFDKLPAGEYYVQLDPKKSSSGLTKPFNFSVFAKSLTEQVEFKA